MCTHWYVHIYAMIGRICTHIETHEVFIYVALPLVYNGEFIVIIVIMCVRVCVCAVAVAASVRLFSVLKLLIRKILFSISRKISHSNSSISIQLYR